MTAVEVAREAPEGNGQIRALGAANEIIHILPSHQIGGAACVAFAVLQHLKRRSRRVRVLLPARGPASERCAATNIPVGYFPDDIRSSNALQAGLANLRLGFMLRGWQKQILHFHYPGLYGSARRCLGRSRSVVHVHSQEGTELLRWSLQRPPRAIVTCAKFLEQAVRQALPASAREAQRVVVLPNAVDIEKFGVAAQGGSKHRVGADAATPLVLMVGNLSLLKGQCTVIRAVARLKALGTKVACWLAGEDRERRGYEKVLAEMAAREGVGDRVKFLGFRNDLERLYAAADLVILPSKSEGMPLTILEAQASRAAVIASPVGGIPEIIEDGKTGWLVGHDDVEGYAQRMKAVIEDAGLRRAVTERAFEYVRRNHNWDDYCRRMIELYDSLG